MEKDFAEEGVLADYQDDFSTNARTDILDKYSRFHGKTEFSVWCNAPDVKYIDSFRDLIFQINPHHITCVYKKMFETSAVSNLRLVDEYTCTEDERGGHSGPAGCINANPDSDYLGYFHEHVDKSNSCVYSTRTNSKTQNISKGDFKMSELHGWDICDRRHSGYNAGYQKVVADEAQDSSKRPGKYAGCRSTSPSFKSFPALLRVTRNSYHGNMRRNSSAGSNGREPSKEASATDSSATRSSSTGSIGTSKTVPIKIGRRFRHFKKNSSYMEQYREEYTYRRLFESREAYPLPDSYICSCGNPSCSDSMTSKSCIPRWYPNQSHLEQSKTSSTCDKDTCITSGIPVPKRTPVLKTRPPPAPKQSRIAPYALQVPKIDDKPNKSSSLGFHRDSIPRLEFFATSLTVNNYNPITTPPSPAHKSGCHSPSSVIMSCGRASACGHTGNPGSPVHISASYHHQLNQNLKGTEQ